MTRGQWLAGSLVILGAILGGAVSAPWAERTFARPPPADADREKAADPEKAADGEHKRTCVTLGGKRFEWNFPNAPFGTLSCSE
jgi:hypothetical protein